MTQWIRIDYGGGKFLEKRFEDWETAQEFGLSLLQHDTTVLGYKLIKEPQESEDSYWKNYFKEKDDE